MDKSNNLTIEDNLAFEQSDAELESLRRDTKNRWLLSLPALVIIMIAAAGPLLIVAIYSFLTPGDYTGVVWRFSTDAWVNVIVERDIFDDTLLWSDAHLKIFWRSFKLSLWTTLSTIIFGVPTAYFIATRSEKTRNIWLFLITVPFWSNMLVRTFAIMELIRNKGVVNSLLQWSGLTDEPIQMLYTDFAIGVGMTYVFLPLMVLPVYAAIEKLDFKLVEGAYDLYASRWNCFRRVIIPLVKPGMIAGSILVFVPCLGSYLVPQVLGGTKNLMFGNLIRLQFGQGRNWPLGAALSLTLMALVIVALLYYVKISTSDRKENV